jgi:hypothetical protein
LFHLVCFNITFAELDGRESLFERVSRSVPLTPQSAKQWLDAMWKLLLMEIPNPENTRAFVSWSNVQA